MTTKDFGILSVFVLGLGVGLWTFMFLFDWDNALWAFFETFLKVAAAMLGIWLIKKIHQCFTRKDNKRETE